MDDWLEYLAMEPSASNVPTAHRVKMEALKPKRTSEGSGISTSSSTSASFSPAHWNYCSSPSYFQLNTLTIVVMAAGLVCFVENVLMGTVKLCIQPSCRKKEKCNDHWFWVATMPSTWSSLQFTSLFSASHFLTELLSDKVSGLRRSLKSAHIQSFAHKKPTTQNTIPDI